LNFGTWLAKKRNESGMSQRDLAAKCELSPAYVATLERGTSEPPPLSTCKSLARALAISSDELWDRSFAARLTRWLKREGFSGMSETELLEIAKNIKSKSK
jgi:transcriptional regulator with XRE-family HTH domain